MDEDRNEMNEEILEKLRKERQKRLDIADSLDEASYEKFLPLVQDIRFESRVAMFNFMLINVRRICMLFMAMFVRGHQWLQL